MCGEMGAFESAFADVEEPGVIAVVPVARAYGVTAGQEARKARKQSS